MKLKNGIYSSMYCLAMISAIIYAKPAHAVIYADQVPSTFAQNNNDDENSDAVSRFGTDAAKKKDKPVAKPLDPISEASFAHDRSRSPASAIEDESSRGPAGATTKKRAKHPLISEEARTKSYQEIAVIANDTGFYPSTVFLTQGIPVRIYITGASAKSQCFMLDQFGVRRQIRSQKIEEVTFVPDQVGTFTFNCPMNGAKGNVIVKELDVNERVPASVSSTSASEPVASAERGFEHSRSAQPAKNNAPDIHDEDFTPEFRNP